MELEMCLFGIQVSCGGEMHDGIVQRFLNIEGQSGVGNNILKIAFLIFLI
jgi:hypothetical protein